jgi:hypothetical protein
VKDLPFVPVDAFSLWDCLHSHHEVTTISSPKVQISKQDVSLSELNLLPPGKFPDAPHDDYSDTEALSPEEG